MSLTSEIDDIIEPILVAFNNVLRTQIANELIIIYLSGSAEMMKWGGVLYEGPPIQEALDWAEKQCGKLVVGMKEETKRRLAKVISDGIEQKKGVYGFGKLGGIQKDLMDTFTDMSKERAYMIARTETCNALSEAALKRMKDMKIEYKEWICAGGDACDICLANQAQGAIPVNQAFSSGHMCPSAHPSCRCAIAPARLRR
jgi:SPP1 gp7 family putative phage head morphogenesis protein